MESAAVVNIFDVSLESAEMSPALCFSSMALAMVTGKKETSWNILLLHYILHFFLVSEENKMLS